MGCGMGELRRALVVALRCRDSACSAFRPKPITEICWPKRLSFPLLDVQMHPGLIHRS